MDANIFHHFSVLARARAGCVCVCNPWSQRGPFVLSFCCTGTGADLPIQSICIGRQALTLWTFDRLESIGNLGSFEFYLDFLGIHT